MDRIVADSKSKQLFGVFNSSADIRITYDPNGRGLGGGHLVYTAANILDDNSVFSALKRKARQLKQSRYPGMRGVILCDGGCHILAEGGNWAEYSLGASRQRTGSKESLNRIHCDDCPSA